MILATAYILLSLAFSITYSTIDAPNFSIGELMTIGAYQSFILANIMNLPVYLSLPLALVLGFLLNSAIYLVIIKPMTDRNRSSVLVTLATLGLSLVLSRLIGVLAYRLRDMYGIYTFVFLLKKFDFQIGSIHGVFLVSSFAVFSVYFIWRHLYIKTKMGISYRAILEDASLAQVQGINRDSLWLKLWGFSGSLACLAGAICPIWFSVSTIAGSLIITPVITASILGGLKNPRGCFIGGLVVGVSEIMFTELIMEHFGVRMGEYRPFIPMIILVLVLFFKPEGLLGFKDQIEKM